MNPKFFAVVFVSPNFPTWLYHHAFACAGGTFPAHTGLEQGKGNGDGHDATPPNEGGRQTSGAWQI